MKIGAKEFLERYTIHFQRFYDVDGELLREVREEDEALLKLAFRYIRSQMDDLYQVL